MRKKLFFVFFVFSLFFTISVFAKEIEFKNVFTQKVQHIYLSSNKSHSKALVNNFG